MAAYDSEETKMVFKDLSIGDDMTHVITPAAAGGGYIGEKTTGDVIVGGEGVSFKDNYIEQPWTVIESYFAGQHLQRLVRHQLESYNMFVTEQIESTINMFNPITIKSTNDYSEEYKKYGLEMTITFSNFKIYRPQIYENNGATKVMFPQEARLRNFTYSSSMTLDINIQITRRTGDELNTTHTGHKILKDIHIGKLPIMLKSAICVLKQYTHVNDELSGAF